MNVTVFEAINITKKYRNTLALNQVSMSVMQGDIYGFIGENGAGKTTMIRLLTGLAEPTTGKIALFGESNKKLAKQRERIGCIIESPSLYLDMTAYENLEVQRLQRGIPGKGCIDNALALVGLKDTGKKKAKDFSLGMRQRLALAIALLGNPEFLVLDEPINGLDPTGIIELRNLLKRLNKERGITILISSHILTELHQLANRYGILHEGKLLQENSRLAKKNDDLREENYLHVQWEAKLKADLDKMIELTERLNLLHQKIAEDYKSTLSSRFDIWSSFWHLLFSKKK